MSRTKLLLGRLLERAESVDHAVNFEARAALRATRGVSGDETPETKGVAINIAQRAWRIRRIAGL